MAFDQGPVVQSARMRCELVRLRKDNELTQEQVADALDWSTSKLIRVEGGKSGISKTDLQALLILYGVTSESRVDRLQEWARGAREQAWWSTYRGAVAESYLNYVGYEAGASHIRHFHGSVVPGLLQTREYAEALSDGEVGTVDVAQSVELRLQRQRKLAERTPPPRQFFILDEAVIRRHVGRDKDPMIMPNQLKHILNITEQSRLVTVRVVPFRAGAHPGLRGPFTLLEFSGKLTDVLYLEGGRAPSVLTIGYDSRITDYQDEFEQLLEPALSADQSLDLIRQAVEELAA